MANNWKYGDSYFDGNSYKTRAQAFAAARKNGSGVFTYKGKQYNTMKKGENADDFRKNHADYDYFLGNVASDQGGWKPSDPVQTSYKVNNVPDVYTGPLPNQKLQEPVRARLSMFTDDDIRNLGFRNYAGMVSAVGNQANANNNFVKALIDRYGSDTNKWDQNTIEKELGVKGTYRSFGRGDFGDMSRSMAGWIGQNNGEIDKQELQNRTGSDGVVYSNSKVRDLFDKVQLKPKQYTFNITPIGSNTPKMEQGGQINMDEQQLQQAFLQFLMQKTGAQNEQQLEQVIQQMGEQGVQQAYAEFMQAMQQQQVQAAKFGAKLNYIKSLNGQCPEGMELHYYKQGGRLCRKCMQAKQNGGELETPSNPIDAFKCGRKIKKDQQGKKLPQIKSKDQATRDSIAANRYNDQDVQINKPGSYKKNAKGQVQWTPDRTKAPYNKVTKHQQGGSFKQAFDNAYGKQRYFTWNGKVYAAYKGDKATDRGFQGAVDNLQEQANALKDYGVGQHLGWNPGANKTGNVRHDRNGNMVGQANEVVVTGKRISPRQRANNQRKQYFDQWTAYVKKWHPNMLGRFKNTMQNMGYNYDWNTGIYSKSGSAYRLNNGQLQTQNIYTGNWHDINNSDVLPGMPANSLAIRLQK